MIPSALLAAKFAQSQGYSIVFIIALCCFPIRGLLAKFIQHLYILVPVQILDGESAGMMGMAVPGLVARVLANTGRFNAGLA